MVAPIVPENAPSSPKKYRNSPVGSQSDALILNDFLSMDYLQQRSYVEWVGGTDLVQLHNLYAIHLGSRALRAQEYAVYERILEKIGGREEYDEFAQESDLRIDLTKEALARVRAETYENDVRPLLHAGEVFQETFVTSLASEEADALGKLLDRYAREYGRSRRCAELEKLVDSRR